MQLPDTRGSVGRVRNRTDEPRGGLTMALRELTGITRSATVAAAAALALAAPSAAVHASTGTDAAGTGAHRTQPVHDATILLPPAPSEPASTSTSWEVLPIATGAAGGIVLVVITFAGVTVVRRRRHEDAHIAHPV